MTKDSFEEAGEPQFDAPRPFSFGLIALAAGITYLGYRLGNAGDSLAETIEPAMDAIKEIQEDVRRVIDAIEDVLEELRKLPEVISGVIDERLMQQTLTQADAYMNLVTAYMRNDETARLNVDAIQRNSDELGVRLQQLLDASEKTLTTAINFGPLISVWAQSFTVVQRIRTQSPPPALSVWDTPVHRQTVDLYKSIFANYHELEPGFTASLDELKDLNKTYNYIASTKSFQISNVPLKSRYDLNEAYPSLFSFTGSMERKLLRTTIRDGSTWKWHVVGMAPMPGEPPVQYPEPQIVAAASNALGLVNERQREARQFFEAFANAETYEQDLARVFTKPSDWP